MDQPRAIMGKKEKRVEGVNEKVDVFVHVRGTPSQLRELFQGPPARPAAGIPIQQGTIAHSISGSACSGIPIQQGTTAHSISGSACSGVQLAEIESGTKDEEKCSAKLCCGRCCRMFSPLVKIVGSLSLLLTSCW